MTYAQFSNLRRVAHQSTTNIEGHALALLEAYAQTGDVAYAVDYALFLKIFGGEAPQGYRFQPYRAMGAATCIVKRA